MNRGEYHNWDGHFKWWTIGPLTIEKGSGTDGFCNGKTVKDIVYGGKNEDCHLL